VTKVDLAPPASPHLLASNSDGRSLDRLRKSLGDVAGVVGRRVLPFGLLPCCVGGLFACSPWASESAGTTTREVCRTDVATAETNASSTCGIADQLACMSAHDCLWGGLCTAVWGSKGACTCVRGSDADCQRSVGCFQSGYCSLVGQSCVAKPKGKCEAGSPACLNSGLCTLVDGECWAGSDLDCQQSLKCAAVGHCGAIPDQYFGTTAWADKKRVCGLVSATDCAKSSHCKALGLCDWDGSHSGQATGVCAPSTPEHCSNSTACKIRGACTLTGTYGKSCVVGSPADCAKSQGCLVDGKCGFDAKEAVCVHP